MATQNPGPPDFDPVVVGVDTGGTFTDFVAVSRQGVVRTLKVPSTPHNPAHAVAQGLEKLGGRRLRSTSWREKGMQNRGFAPGVCFWRHLLRPEWP